MKAYMKDRRVWLAMGRTVLALLLCLSGGAVAAMPAGSVRGGKMEIITVPEGYRPLPVTEFVINVEKNDTYGIAVGVEYQGEPSDAQEWLEKNIVGEIKIYRIKDNELISTHFVFNKKNNHSYSGVNRVYLNRDFQGETYDISLSKGGYVISSHLFFNEVASSQIPQSFVSFGRLRKPWW